MTLTGLLVVSNIKQLGHALQHIGKYVRTLFIHLHIPAGELKAKPAPTWGKVISQLYVDSSKYNKNIGMGQLDINVLVAPIKGHAINGLRPIQMLFSDCDCPELCAKLRKELNIPSETIYLQQENLAITSILDKIDKCDDIAQGATDQSAQKMYNTVVLGGTFDRMHLGHKIFLTHAVLRACRRLVVGVTTAEMTHSKVLWELIQPVEERIESVRKFLKEIDCSLQYEVVPINDPFGPTRTDPDMDMIIVSEETLRGGHKVNEIRVKNNLRPLEIFTVSLVESQDKSGPKESKVSSSNTRIDLLGARLRKPEQKPHLQNDPYIIGLTGGIASGKSQMSQRFRDMGAVIMNCDHIAHEIYEPGQVCYEKVIQYFGKDILEEGGLKIDRKKLAAIVFGKKQELAKLDEIVWPELILEVKRRIQAMVKNGPKKTVVIIEAAILLQAGWENECHEVWSMIVPPEMAVRRVMDRNGLSEEDARKRMASQFSNAEIVARSNVVFSSQWDEEFTQKQAERAWKMLQTELNTPTNEYSRTNSML